MSESKSMIDDSEHDGSEESMSHTPDQENALYIEWLKNKYSDVTELNKACNGSYSTFEEFSQYSLANVNKAVAETAEVATANAMNARFRKSRKNALVKIQTFWRRLKAQRVLENLKWRKTRRIAATKIQSLLRGLKAQRVLCTQLPPKSDVVAEAKARARAAQKARTQRRISQLTSEHGGGGEPDSDSAVTDEIEQNGHEEYFTADQGPMAFAASVLSSFWGGRENSSTDPELSSDSFEEDCGGKRNENCEDKGDDDHEDLKECFVVMANDSPIFYINNRAIARAKMREIAHSLSVGYRDYKAYIEEVSPDGVNLVGTYKYYVISHCRTLERLRVVCVPKLTCYSHTTLARRLLVSAYGDQ